MSKTCKVCVDNEVLTANVGDLLLDAALMNGVDIPFDCRAGHCGTCRVRVVEGQFFGGANDDPDTVMACQCRITSDAKVVLEDVPEIVTRSGYIAKLTNLAQDVIEVAVEPSRPTPYLPGQYFQLRLRDFPARFYSAAAPLSRRHDDPLVRFQVRVLPRGRVSSRLGRKIHAGHRIKLTGPMGFAYLRPRLKNRLVLVASGTGFAPIWSIADAAMRENSTRELVLIVGARKVESLYMIEALCRLARCPNVTIIPVVSERQSVSAAIRYGHPVDYLPALSPDDIVYAAGAPRIVGAVASLARAAGARCFSDPFEAAINVSDERSIAGRMMHWLGGRTVDLASTTHRAVLQTQVHA